MDLKGVILGKLSKMQKVTLHDCIYMWKQTNKKKQAETENRSEKFRGLRWVSAGKDNTWVKRVKRHKPPGLSHGNETYSILTVVNDVCWVCESCQEDRSLNFS